MFNAKEFSIAQRLTWMNLLVSGVALLVACSAFIGYDVMTSRTVMLRGLSIRAQVIGSNSVSALLFNDPDSAENTVSAALKVDPHIRSAVIWYSSMGSLLPPSWAQGSKRIPPEPEIPPAQEEIHQINGSEIVLARHIVSDGKAIGIICIRSDVEALDGSSTPGSFCGDRRALVLLGIYARRFAGVFQVPKN